MDLTSQHEEPANDVGGTDGPSKSDGDVDDELGGVPIEIEHLSSPKKKRKKSKPKSQRGLYHADGPLRPEDAAEDRELYSKDFPFINRILTAIQRFERTRKLTPERRDVFYKYLAHGGVDVGPQMFQSVDAFGKEAREGMSKVELAAAMSQLSIGDDKYDTTSPAATYTVDFEGCMKGFLSRRAHVLFGSDTRASVSMVTTTLERFMDYLLQHDVCPEHKVQVLATRDLCREAHSELWAVSEASRWLPGDFNIACSTLFQGQYARNYDGATDWGPTQQGVAAFVGMTPSVADKVLKFGVAGAASEDVYQAFQSRNQADKFEDRVQVLETKHHVGFEITSIIPPSKSCIQLYKSRSQDFRPVGRVYARPWKNPDASPEDLTKEEKETPIRKVIPESNEEYIFFIESVILNNLHIGFKIEATVHKLNCGLWFFDEFVNIFASFDTCLINNMISDWKQPRWLDGSVEYEKQQQLRRQQELEQERILEQDDDEADGRGTGQETSTNEAVNAETEASGRPEVGTEDAEPY